MATIYKYNVPPRHQYLESKLKFIGQAEQLLQRADAFYRASDIYLRVGEGANPHDVNGRTILEEAVFNATVLAYGTPFKDPKFAGYYKNAKIFDGDLLEVHKNILRLRDKSVAHMESYTSKASVCIELEEDTGKLDIDAQCIYFAPVYIFPNIAPNLKLCIDVARRWFRGEHKATRISLKTDVESRICRTRNQLVRAEDKTAQARLEIDQAIRQMAKEYASPIKSPI